MIQIRLTRNYMHRSLTARFEILRIAKPYSYVGIAFASTWKLVLSGGISPFPLIMALDRGTITLLVYCMDSYETNMQVHKGYIGSMALTIFLSVGSMSPLDLSTASEGILRVVRSICRTRKICLIRGFWAVSTNAHASRASVFIVTAKVIYSHGVEWGSFCCTGFCARRAKTGQRIEPVLDTRLRDI